MTPDPRLIGITSDDLRAEIARRAAADESALWERRIKTAKYLCYGCGYPDGWHATTCPTDTDCT